jgi:hypothetical protein
MFLFSLQRADLFTSGPIRLRMYWWYSVSLGGGGGGSIKLTIPLHIKARLKNAGQNTSVLPHV